MIYAIIWAVGCLVGFLLGRWNPSDEEDVPENRWETGSLVRLRSGGPTMTVYDIEDPNVACTWFDVGRCRSEWMAADALVDAPEEEEVVR